jgi:hypothetical protein
MGREVEEVVETTSSENKSEGDIILGHNEALRRVRQSIADLASGLNEVDRYVTRSSLLYNVLRHDFLLALAPSWNLTKSAWTS